MNVPVSMNIQDFSIESIQHKSKQSYLLKFGSGENHLEVIPVNVIKGNLRGPTLVIFAGIHGDEYEGTQTIIRIYRDLSPEDIRGTLVMVPVANLSAYHAGTRISQTDHENLARAFPGLPNGSYTSRLAWHLQNSFISKADFFLDLHSGGTHYAMPLLVGYYENDQSELGRKSRAAAESFGIPVLWGHETIGLGRTISSALEHNVAWLYVEGYGGKRIKIEEQKQYETGIYRLLHHLQMLRETEKLNHLPPARVTHRVIGDGNLDHATTAETDGFFVPSVKLLDRVEAGQTVGVIYDLYGNTLQTVRTSQAGVVMMLRGTPYTKQGDGLFFVAPVCEQGI